MTKTVAFIGLGWVVREIWLPRFAEHSGFQIVAGFDPNKGVASVVQDTTPSLKVCSSMEQVLNTQPDLVVVAVPNYLHVDMAELCLKRDISVLLEKPICLNIEEFHRLKFAVTNSGGILLPSKASRLRLDVCKMRELINSDLIGKVCSMDLRWLRKSGIPKPGSWFTNKRLAGGGVGYDLGWHVLDVGFEMLSYPRIVEAYGVPISNYGPEKKGSFVGADWREDTAVGGSVNCDVETQMIALARTDDGVAINMNVAWVSNTGTDYTKIAIHGQFGSLELTTTFGLSPNRLSLPSLRLYKGGDIKSFDLPNSKIGNEYDAQVELVHDCLSGCARVSEISEIESVVNVLDRIYSPAC